MPHHHHHHHAAHSARVVPFVANLKPRTKGEDLLPRILLRDRARLVKFREGSIPHGPKVIGESFRRKVADTRQAASGGADIDGDATVAASGTGTTVDVTDAAVTYTASVGVGSPATTFTLLIDTGSSNTWVGAQTKYTSTSTSQDTGSGVSVSYGSGSFSGEEWTDRVDLGGGLVIEQQSIGVASTAQGFDDVDGILGIGPVDLTAGTLTSGSSSGKHGHHGGGSSQPSTETIPTVTDNLFSQGTIPTNSIGISYEPTTSEDATVNGELTFGGTDSSKFTGEITYTPITKTSPASAYWGIDQIVTYGTSGTAILGSASSGSTNPGIVDTGTTLLLLATDAFQKYESATGAKLDNTTGLLTLTEAQFEKLEDLNFIINGTTFTFPPNAQIWPRALNSTMGGEEGKIYLIVGDLGSESGSGLDFINGFAWCK